VVSQIEIMSSLRLNYTVSGDFLLNRVFFLSLFLKSDTRFSLFSLENQPFNLWRNLQQPAFYHPYLHSYPHSKIQFHFEIDVLLYLVLLVVLSRYTKYCLHRVNSWCLSLGCRRSSLFREEINTNILWNLSTESW